MKTHLYTAFIADIVDSRKIEDRKNVQNKLKKILDDINIKFEESIESKFIITLGDEFQGLLKSNVDIMQIINYIQFEMYPIKFRIGLGIGEINTSINMEFALGADGPAYYNARSAIEFVGKNEKSNLTYETSICIYPEDSNKIKLLNLVLAMYSSLFNKWDEDLYKTVKLIQEGNTQQEASDILKINQSSVRRRLEKAGYYNFLHMHEVLTSILGEGYLDE